MYKKIIVNIHIYILSFRKIKIKKLIKKIKILTNFQLFINSFTYKKLI